ncbi:RYamide receptor-like [Pieris rapae]|uniref:RYamide receptor-like n=1 Tax=Pieris rapae TaxID=64459 RepID=UPI001E281A94|nr:RYamide receptor-like [Pieris rapae]
MSMFYVGENTTLSYVILCGTEYFQNDTLNDTFGNHTGTSPHSCASIKKSETFFTSFTFHLCVYFMYSIIFASSLFGNGLVCFVVNSSTQMKTVTNLFIVNLAVGDIMMTIFCVPFSFVSTLVLQHWPFGPVMCKIVNFSQAVSVLVSAYTLLAISVDRYIVITKPLKPRLGKNIAKLIIMAVWIGAMITAVPILVVSRLQRPTIWHEVCELDICSEMWPEPKQMTHYTWALLTLQFLLPLIVLISTYTKIACMVWGEQPPGEADMNRDSRIQQSKRKMIKMMVAVVTVFTICWLPLNVFLMFWSAHENDEEWITWPGMPYVWFLCHWLAMSHCCYNPVIYCYMNSRYRRGFQEALRRLVCRHKNATSCSSHRFSVCEAIPLSELNDGRLFRRSTCICQRRARPSTAKSSKQNSIQNCQRNVTLSVPSKLFN